MVSLTRRVDEVIEKLFPNKDEHETVQAILMEECSDTLPLVGNPEERECIQLAVLKLSRGEAYRLLEAAALARVDWRDVLMAAGFGSDVEAHLRWVEEMK